MIGAQHDERLESGAEAGSGPRTAEHAADVGVTAAARDLLAVAGHEGGEHHAGLIMIAAQFSEIEMERDVRRRRRTAPAMRSRLSNAPYTTQPPWRRRERASGSTSAAPFRSTSAE